MQDGYGAIGVVSARKLLISGLGLPVKLIVTAPTTTETFSWHIASTLYSANKSPRYPGNITNEENRKEESYRNNKAVYL